MSFFKNLLSAGKTVLGSVVGGGAGNTGITGGGKGGTALQVLSKGAGILGAVKGAVGSLFGKGGGATNSAQQAASNLVISSGANGLKIETGQNTNQILGLEPWQFFLFVIGLPLVIIVLIVVFATKGGKR